MQEKNNFSQQEINKKISNLRLKLIKMYEKQGHTNEVIRISKELDRYIILAQQQLLDK